MGNVAKSFQIERVLPLSLDLVVISTLIIWILVLTWTKMLLLS